MRYRFELNFDTMPKGTSQEKGYNTFTKVHFKKPTVRATEGIFFAKLLKNAPKEPSTKPIRLTVWFSWDVKDKHMWGCYKPTRPDTDNYIKLFKDTMTKAGFWIDDSQVVDERIIKTYSHRAFIWVDFEEIEDKHFGGIK